MRTHLETTIEEALNALQEHKYSKAESLFRGALQKAQDEHNDLLAATCLDNLGESAFQQGWFEQAEPYFERALEIRRKKLPGGHEDIIASLNNLAAAYFFQGKYTLAKPLCQQLMATYELVLGRDHPEIATCLINLGLIAMAEAKLGNAEKSFAQAHVIRCAAYDPMHILVGNSLSHLGNAYYEQKRYDLAAQKFKEALAILEKHFNLDNADLAAVVTKLIFSLEQIGDLTELELLYPRLINLNEIKLGPAHGDVAKYLEKLANLQLKQGKHEEAEKLFQRLLSMKRRAFGDAHPEVAGQLTNLASIREAMGNAAQAETLLLQVLNVYEGAKRKDHTGQSASFPKYMESLRNLAAFYERDKRYAKAEKQWQQLLQLVEPQSARHPQLLLEAYEHLSTSLLAQKKLNEAESTLRKALKFITENISANKLTSNSQALTNYDYKLNQAFLMTKLADILKSQNKLSEAETEYQNALDILMKSLGSNHPDLAATLESYADLLMRTYREAEAEHMLSCAKNLTKKQVESK